MAAKKTASRWKPRLTLFAVLMGAPPCARESLRSVRPQDSLTIDLDGRIVIWGSDTYPITEIEGNHFTFKGEVEDRREGAPAVTPAIWNHYTIGVMDRITGDLSLSQNDKCDKLGLYHKTTFNLHCKPAKPLF